MRWERIAVESVSSQSADADERPMKGDASRNPGFLAWLESRLAAEEEDPLPLALRAALTVLSWAYHGLYLVDRMPYGLGWRRSIHPGVPIVGLGNLVAGGTGKTPCTIWLANRLRQAGLRPVVISHGYKGRAAAPLVVSGGQVPVSSLPEEAGDEARLSALSCPGVPVLAGRDRVAAASILVLPYPTSLRGSCHTSSIRCR